ncbi:MAG TPA: SDR family NAD(P)-dependent oxidoreductase [Acidimicrobiales bacterium]|nr:SDR family NAD(P)-dependent oxidoreductase [Acidimicrobiales bacterium]
MTNLAFDFSGRTAIITGAARGIGLELARFFTTAGAHVVMVDNDREALEASAADVGGRPAPADIRDTAQVQEVVDQALAGTGRVDILINNAGLVRDRVLWKLTDDEWELVVAVHLGGTFKFTRACVAPFRAQGTGRVVNVTSYTGLHGNIGQSNYAGAKAGIVGFTKTAAKELARFGVTVNAISPNARTRMLDGIPDEHFRQLVGQIPLGRFGEPVEMCAAVGFLVSDEAAYVTGVVLPVDGGMSI